MVKFKVTDQCIWCDHYPMHMQNIKTPHCVSEICIIYVNQNRRRKEFHPLLTLWSSECANGWFSSTVPKVLLTFCFIQLSSFSLRLLHVLCKCTLRLLCFLHPGPYSKLSSSTPTWIPPGMSHKETSHHSAFFLLIMPVSFQYLYRSNYPHQSSGVLPHLGPFLL